MSIRPLHDRVLVKRDPEEATSAGGIVIPNNKEKPVSGRIVAVGNGKVTDSGELHSLEVKVGDKVYFGKYSGTELTVDHEELLMMREDDIMGVEE